MARGTKRHKRQTRRHGATPGRPSKGGGRNRVDRAARSEPRGSTGLERKGVPRGSGRDALPRTRSAAPAPSTRITSRALAPSASLIVGCAIGMVVAGLTQTLERTLSPFGMTPRTVVAACLVALGAGVILPRSFVLWLGAVARRRVVGSPDPNEPAMLLAPDGPPDRPLHWSVLSVVALAAGFSVAVAPLVIPVTRGLAQALWNDFVWSAAPLALLNLTVAGAVAAIPLGLLGITLSAVHHLSCPHCRWEPAATTWLLCGAAVGVAFSALVSHVGTDPVLPMLAAALPAFLLSICCMVFASLDGGPREAPGQDNDALPLSSDPYPRLTRFCVVAVGGGAGCAIYVWSVVLPARPTFDAGVVAGSLAAMGVGVQLGSHTGRMVVRFISSFGLACAAAGVLVAVAAAVPVTADANPVRMIPAYISLGGIGYAMAVGRALLMHRVGSRAHEGPRTTSRVLYCAAVSCWLAAPAAIGAFGAHATLVMLALSLLALGGILIVHDPVVSRLARRTRLAFVFSAVGVMIVIGSSGANPWRRSVPTTLPALGAHIVSRDLEQH